MTSINIETMHNDETIIHGMDKIMKFITYQFNTIKELKEKIKVMEFYKEDNEKEFAATVKFWHESGEENEKLKEENDAYKCLTGRLTEENDELTEENEALEEKITCLESNSHNEVSQAEFDDAIDERDEEIKKLNYKIKSYKCLTGRLTEENEALYINEKIREPLIQKLTLENKELKEDAFAALSMINNSMK